MRYQNFGSHSMPKQWESMTQEERNAFVEMLPSNASLRVHELKTVQVRTIPDSLEFGKLYVSKEFELSIHLCACGWCAVKTVLPFYNANFPIGHNGWTHDELADGQYTIAPSIGNWQMPCHSHYYIRNGKVEWLSGLDCFGKEEGGPT